ncbi:MAG: DUF3237 family protein [Acidimicrobiales bacterium]
MSVDFGPMQLLTTPMGTRLNYVVKQGVVDGPMLRGELLPGGDWVLVGSDGVARLNVRATLRTDDDQLVYVTNTGRDEAYARPVPLFETGAEPLHVAQQRGHHRCQPAVPHPRRLPHLPGPMTQVSTAQLPQPDGGRREVRFDCLDVVTLDDPGPAAAPAPRPAGAEPGAVALLSSGT